MVVQHNLTAMNANRYLGINNSKLSKSLEKLSSGYAINRAGDNAAGLAVSEKMRSQIAGMTQGVKNAQDGISMVQTFEGALTETDSILQRMKTLADQAANGTYQDDVDRDAIQLEFDQLNDELNQIADTDFNGVVVLNGGQMADGTVAVDGKFDYTLGRTATVVAAEAIDISGSQNQAHTIVDQSAYDKAKADAVFDTIGVDVSTLKDGKANVTFMYDGERWMAQTVTDSTGNIIKGANAAKLEAREVERDGATGRGGFEVIAGKDPYTGKDIVATNAIFDEMQGLKKGDTLTITFENSAAKTYAPKNAGLDEDHAGQATGKAFKFDAATQTKIDDGTSTISAEALAGKVSFALDKDIKDEAMSKELSLALKALDGVDIEMEYEDGAVKGASYDINTDKIDAGDDTALQAAAAKLEIDEDGTIYYGTKGADGTITLGKIDTKAIQIDKAAYTETKWSVANVGTPTGITNATTDADGDGNTVQPTFTIDMADATKKQAFLDDTTIKGYLKDGVTALKFTSENATATTFKVEDQDGKELATGVAKATIAAATGLVAVKGGDDGSLNGANFTITVASQKIEHAAQKTNDTNADGKFTISLNVDAFNFADMSTLSVHATDTPKVATMASQVAKEGVSVSNAHGNGSAPLTYTDNITLQTGARSKDAVNFTFKYTSGGMGNLKSNMNCSAREDGLNTASLSLKTAESANYAIDQIDNAINKVSMVRATFGAVQNRLEHKIDNMNVSIENLTSAESQIRDTDMPTEMMNFTKQQILAQASQSMLAQANQLPQSVLSLLQ